MNLTFLVLTVFLYVLNGLLPNTVGLRKRIVEGETDWLNQYNYQVSIQVKKWRTGLYEHGCGGSILNEEFILTAAHCFISKNGTILDITNDRVKILAGTNTLDSGGIYANVDKVYVYKGYNHTDHVALGDIAVIKLRDKLDVKNDPRLSAIQTPRKASYDAYVNKEATVSGFGVRKFELVRDENGKTITKGVLSNIRQFLFVKTVSKDKCSAYDSIICTILSQQDFNFFLRGVCSGDSGGPLVYNGTVIGVVSTAATNCDMRSKTAKYTRVVSYIDFLKRVVKDANDKSDMIILSNT